MGMKRHNIWRAFAVLAAIAFVQASVGLTLIQAERSLADCVNGCNNARALCRDECQLDCALLYPPGSPDYDACNSVCSESCNAESFECKAKCNPRRIPSPTEP